MSLIDCGIYTDPTISVRHVLPIGNSITYGSQSIVVGGYRYFLKPTLIERGWVYCGRQVDAVGGHEGHPSYTAVALTTMIGDMRFWCAPHSVVPHLIIVEAGTNDLVSLSPSAAATDLSNLLYTVIASYPTSPIVVSNLVPTTTTTGLRSDTTVTAFNALVPAIISALTTYGSSVDLADVNTAIKAQANWQTVDISGDGVHPLDAGYAVMATEYVASMGRLIGRGVLW